MSSKEETGPSPKDLSDSKRRLLEQRLRGRRASTPAAAEIIPRRASNLPQLASPGQQWIYVAQESVPVSAGFNITSSFRVNGPLDAKALERSVNLVVARHEILRSNYRLRDKDVELIVHNAFTLRLSVDHCDDIADVTARAETLSRIPFDLRSGPLLRVHYMHDNQGTGLLMLVIHDIIFDKWSLGLFWSEIAALYREALEGKAAQLSPLEIQYSDFAAWQREQLATGRFENQLSYWSDKLEGLPPPIPLSTDRPYPSILTDAGRLERHRLGATLTGRLKQYAAGENASLFMVTLLAYQILLSRYSGSKDIIVGSPVANRRRKETANLIGFFLSTVALRTRFTDDLEVGQALEQVRTATLEAIENQDVPFNRVVEAVKPPRLPGRHPLCQVMFVYQRENEAAPEFDLGAVNLEHTYVETGTSKFDLTLFAAESGEEMEIILEYRTDLFDRETIQRIIRHYERILELMVENPKRRIAGFDWLTQKERKTLFEEWQGPSAPPTGIPSVIGQIAAQTQALPEAPAVIGSAESLSYDRLDHLSNAIAARLRAVGAGPGKNVAHLMDRSPTAVAAILGILKTGAAYVPVDPHYPNDRQRFIINDAGIEIAVTTREGRPEAALVPQTIVVESDSEDGTDKSSPKEPSIDPEFPAYLIYTSGSTGQPKGVVVSHSNLLYSTAARVHTYTSPPERFLLIPSFSFDSSVAGIFWTLTQGGALIIPEADDLRDPARLRRLIHDQGVTDLLCVPTLYREILRDGANELIGLKRVIVAGESCPKNLVAMHHRLVPGTDFFNEYGPTEATVWATVHRCTGDDADGGGSVPIGRPIVNMKAVVLDEHQSPVPVGVPGELHLGGPGIARGYWKREELTTERFGECNLPVLGRMRLYRTGDLARWRPNGSLEFLGRRDGQMKIRGYRIEAGEIEAALTQHPLIEQAVVVATTPNLSPSIEATKLSDPDSIINSVPESELDRILSNIESLTPDEVIEALGKSQLPNPRVPDRVIDRDRFRVELSAKAPDFVDTPREAQRNWLLSQAMGEIVDDLEFIDQAAVSFVPGYDHQLGSDLLDITQSELGDQEIMEDWQTPLMKAMARNVTGSHGDILEIGFGRGVSADFIQQQGVRSHTVVEPNRHSIEHYFHPWRKKHAAQDIHLLEGRWQDVEDELGQDDGIFFHAFPLNEDEFTKYVLESVTFAEHAFGPMAAHLKPGGAFTYLTTEINSLSRRHQRCLFRHFQSLSLSVEKLSIPSDTRDTWWADSMVVIRAVK